MLDQFADDSEEFDEDLFVRVARSFTTEDRPRVLFLTGGEALLRPRLVQELIRLAHGVDTKVYLISGMFFARHGTIPPAIRAAIAGVDHFSASLDVFHEAQVSRADVLRALHEVRAMGKDISIQVTGTDAADPYLAEVTSDIRRSFDDRVPAIVTQLSSVGRAKDWLPAAERPHHVSLEFAPAPCVAATWPVVSFDGTVVACCNQSVVDGPPPAHLRLGHAASDGWATIRDRFLTSPMVRGIRVFGPEYLAATYSAGTVACDGYCSTCKRLSDDPAIAAGLEQTMARPTMATIEKLVATMQQGEWLGSYVVPEYIYMAKLGFEQQTAEPTAPALVAV